MFKKGPTILDFHVKDCLLYYEYPNHSIGFFSIRLFTYNGLTSLMEHLKKFPKIEKIFGVIDFYGTFSCLFLKFKFFSLEEIPSFKNLVLQILSSYEKNIKFKLLKNNKLEEFFFFFLDQIHYDEFHLKICRKEKYISVHNIKNFKEYIFFRFKINQSNFKLEHINQLYHFIQTIKINGFLLFTLNSSQKFNVSSLFVAKSYDRFINFLNFDKSLLNSQKFKLNDITKRDFVNLIKKNQLLDSTLIEKSDFENVIKIFRLKKQKLNSIKDSANLKGEQLKTKIMSILKDSLIKYQIMKNKDIFLNSLNTKIIILGNDFNRLYKFLQYHYFDEYFIILFISDQPTYRLLIKNTSINELKKVKIFHKGMFTPFQNYIVKINQKLILNIQ